MKKTTKIWLSVGAGLLLLGLMIIGGVMCAFGWDFSKIDGNKLDTKSYEIKETFSDISIDTEIAGVEIVRTEESGVTVICNDRKNLAHTVRVEDARLVIELNDTRKWYNYIGINIGVPRITVGLPAAEYGALDISATTGSVKVGEGLRFSEVGIAVTTGTIRCCASSAGDMSLAATTGSIHLSDISARNISMSVTTGELGVRRVSADGNFSFNVTTGDAEISDVTAASVISIGSTGDVELENTVATKKMTITRSTGDVELERCDAGELEIKTDTGDVEGSLRTPKIFIVDTDTGRKRVPETTTGGRCRITTDTGDIEIRID